MQQPYSWNNLKFVIEDPDVYLICNYTNEDIDLNKAILFQWEPDMIIKNRFPLKWQDPSQLPLLSNKSIDKYHNIVCWFISLNHNILQFVPTNKTKLISTVTSSKKDYDLHKKRLALINSTKNIIPELDIFGVGINEITNKEFGLLPYKYTIACENCRQKNYFTEKILDPILCECLTFYDGCPNISDFIDPEVFIKIYLDDIAKSINIIKENIKNNTWEKKIDLIKKEKDRILNELQIMPDLERIINEKLFNRNN